MLLERKKLRRVQLGKLPFTSHFKINSVRMLSRHLATQSMENGREGERKETLL